MWFDISLVYTLVIPPKGRCYSIKIHKGFAPRESLSISINTTGLEISAKRLENISRAKALNFRKFPNSSLLLFVHHDEGSLIGLYGSAFPLGAAKKVDFSEDTLKKVGLVKELHLRLVYSTGCSQDETTGTFIRCSKEEMVRKVRGNKEGN